MKESLSPFLKSFPKVPEGMREKERERSAFNQKLHWLSLSLCSVCFHMENFVVWARNGGRDLELKLTFHPQESRKRQKCLVVLCYAIQYKNGFFPHVSPGIWRPQNVIQRTLFMGMYAAVQHPPKHNATTEKKPIVHFLCMYDVSHFHASQTHEKSSSICHFVLLMYIYGTHYKHNTLVV